MEKEQLMKKEEVQNTVTWKPKEESVSRRKEWFLTVTGTEMSEVVSGSGNRKFIDGFDRDI